MGWISGMGAGAWIWMLVWVFALLAMVWLIVRPDPHAPADDPNAILRVRFARGEIDDDGVAPPKLRDVSGTPHGYPSDRGGTAV